MTTNNLFYICYGTLLIVMTIVLIIGIIENRSIYKDIKYLKNQNDKHKIAIYKIEAENRKTLTNIK